MNCLHRRRSLAIRGHAGPKWLMSLSLHLFLGLSCLLAHSRGVHSIHLLYVIQAMCHAGSCIHFVITLTMSFTPACCLILVALIKPF